MKKIAICAAALGLSFAACGDDDRKGGGGDGGTGGTGGTAEVRTSIEIENGEGRVFVGNEALITIRQPSSQTAPAAVLLLVQGKEDTDGDGVGDGGAYDIQFRTTGNTLLTGELQSGAVVATQPTEPGQAKVDTFDAEGELVWGSARDKVNFALSGGGIEGEVISEKPAIESTISGQYRIRCEILEGTEHVQDRDLTTAFCTPFRELLPAE